MNLFAHPLWPANLPSHPTIGPYWRLLRLDKPVGSMLILWPTLASLWIAGEGRPDIELMIIFILGTFLMRAAGCAINDYADRGIDGNVTRTTQRPLATGELAPRNALYAFTLLCVISFGLVLLTNQLTIYLSFAGAALTSIYPFLKRFTHLPQIWLGLAMNWGIVMAYSAQAGSLHPGISVFYAATILWTVVYDCFYAMVDREDDLKIGVKSIAILFGEQDRLFCGILQCLSIFAFYLAGKLLELGMFYFLFTVAGLAILFTYQQYLAKDRDRVGCFAAFMNNRWAALLIFAGVFADTSF